MTLTEMKYYKKQLGYSLDQLAELSGVPRGTLQKIFSGETKAPRYNTLKAIEAVLKSAETEDASSYHYGDSEDETQKWCVAERAFAYKSSRQKTEEIRFRIEDYYALPDKQRVELIDGVFYDMAAPTVSHQMLAGELYFIFRNYIEAQGGQCVPLLSPVDVQLDGDDDTMVEPDFIVVCDRDKLQKRCVFGAPDFVVEILSPGSRKRDAFLKLRKYADAGVREYWMVDPEKNRVVVYCFEEDDIPTIYGSDAVIPVKIFDGQMKISVAELFGKILS